jgi:hypothetical protein
MPKNKDAEVKIKLSSGAEVRMLFTDSKMAETQYNQLKGQGTYMGQWILEITIL